MIIAVDFDGTLCENNWPEIGKPNWFVINRLTERRAVGDKLILWTCREGDELEEAILWCLNHGLRFDAVNGNLPEMTEKYGNDCRKVFADEYWDDKAVIASGHRVIRYIPPKMGRPDVGITHTERPRRLWMKLWKWFFGEDFW